jgi:hypothetical protein
MRYGNPYDHVGPSESDGKTTNKAPGDTKIGSTLAYFSTIDNSNECVIRTTPKSGYPKNSFTKSSFA